MKTPPKPPRSNWRERINLHSCLYNIHEVLDYIDGKGEKVTPTNVGSLMIVQEKGVKSGRYTAEEAEAWYLKMCGPREMNEASKAHYLQRKNEMQTQRL